MKLSIVGNCQVEGLAACTRAMLPQAEVHAILGGMSLAPAYDSDIVLYHPDHPIDPAAIPAPAKLKPVLPFKYLAFHPDLIYASCGDRLVRSPLADYNSALVLYGWMNRLSVGRTVRLFCDPVYDHLGYYDYTAASQQSLADAGARCGVDVARLLEQCSKRGCFAHSINHPKLFVLSSIAATTLEALD